MSCASAKFFIQMNFFWHFGHSLLKKISALICENLVRLTLKMFKLQKKEPQNFQKKRFPKKIISIIHNLLYLPFKKNFVDKNLCEWMTSTKKKEKKSTQNPLPTPCLFSKFYPILAFWFKIPKYSFFLSFLNVLYIYDYNKFLTYIPGDFCFCTVCLFKLNFRTQKDFFSFG